MKFQLLLLSSFLIGACNNPAPSSNTDTSTVDTVVNHDTVPVEKPGPQQRDTTPVKKDTAAVKKYSNGRFKNVTVEKSGANSYVVKGRAQVFEAAFSWVVEDGHNELMQGHEMTDAGAPEWGKFRFVINVKKATNNSTLHLLLFENSAKDGSRQYELPIPLPE